MLKENFPITKMNILAFLENGKTYLRVPRSSPRGAEGGLLFHTVFCRLPRTESCLTLTCLHLYLIAQGCVSANAPSLYSTIYIYPSRRSPPADQSEPSISRTTYVGLQVALYHPLYHVYRVLKIILGRVQELFARKKICDIVPQSTIQ